MDTARLLLVLVLAIVSCHPAGAFEIIDCTSGKDSDAKLLSLASSSCPDTSVDRCTLTRGQNATLKINFQPTKVFAHSNISIKAKLHHLPIPFHFDGPSDACGNYGFNCPVKVGDQVQMRFSLPILRTYPAVKAVVHFEMTDEQKRPIVCFEFPVQLK